MDLNPLRSGRADGGWPAIVVAGPTGAGKSSLALRVAGRFSGEVVNCDSVQVFRHFDIGAAKLSPAEQLGIPHHLIDIADPTAHFTAGDYARQARKALREIGDRARLPIITGGTGLYLRALLTGLSPGPTRDTFLRERLLTRERRRPGSLWRILARLDRTASERIHRNDVKKTIRAIEVRLAGGKPISQIFQEGRDELTGFRALKIILNPGREQLNAGLDERLAWMFEHGLIEETRHILDLGYTSEVKPFQSLGYKQALQVIRGDLTREQALKEAQTRTRQYAKRQITWFRKEPGAIWLNGFGSDPGIERQTFDLVETHLNG